MSAWGSTAPSNFQKIKKSSKPRPPPYNRQPLSNTHSRNRICYRTSIPRTEKRHQNPHTAVQIHISKKSPNALKSRKETPKTSEKVQLSRVCTNPTKTSRNSTLFSRMKIYQHINNSHCGMLLKALVVVKDSIPGLARKDSMSLQDLETKTSDFINTNYPTELWIRVYTDGSAEEAVRNGGGGVLIEWLDGTKIENSIPTGRHSTNYKAEAAAIEEAVALLHTPKSYNKNIVLLSDAKSVLQALHNTRNREHSNLKASLLQLGLSAQHIVLQWLPGRCNIWGNTRADQLAKEGSQLEQLDGGSSYAESKTLIKAAMARKWKSDHPDSDPSEPIHGMTRSQQTIIFRLRTGHNRLRQHMYKRFKVGDSEICPCGQAPQNTEHVLQTCSSHRQLRARKWPNHTPLEKKLYGTTEELALTVTVDYIVASGLTV